jgi:5-methylcytosine-specific restriction endonuclease McrBC regulatory subunit McrC
MIILTGLIYLITRKKSKAWAFKQAMGKVWKYYIIMWVILIVLTCITVKTMFILSGY